MEAEPSELPPLAPLSGKGVSRGRRGRLRGMRCRNTLLPVHPVTKTSRVNNGQRPWLVEGSQVTERSERFHYLPVDSDRLGEGGAAVDDAMADRIDTAVRPDRIHDEMKTVEIVESMTMSKGVVVVSSSLYPRTWMLEWLVRPEARR